MPAPIRRRLTARRLLLADLAMLAALIITGCVQAFLLHPTETRTTAHALTATRGGYVDPYRSQDGNGHVWLTTAALVRIDRLPSGQAGDRVLLDAPSRLRAGQTLTVYVGADGNQVRAAQLPGPPVLPRGQGAALLTGLIALVPLSRRVRRQRRTAAAADRDGPASGTGTANASGDEPPRGGPRSGKRRAAHA